MTASARRLITFPFVALFVATLAFFTAGGTVLPVATRFADGPLGADALGVGIGIGAYAVASLLVRPVVGWSADRFGRRPLLVGGGLVSIAALVAHLAADTLPAFVVVRCLLGIGEALFFVAAVTAVSDLAPPTRRGEAINVGSLAVYLGLAAGPLLGETVLAASGFTAVWLVAAAMAAVATGLSVLVPETVPSLAGRGGTEPRAAAAAGGSEDVSPYSARLIHPAGVLPGILILTGTWGMAGFFAFVPLHADALGLEGAGIPLAMYALIVIGLRIVFAKLPDQVGAARLSGGALLVSAVGLAMIGALPGALGLYLGTAVFAVGIAFMFPALLAVAVARVPETERGSVVGTSSAFLDLSFGLSPAVLGMIATSRGYPAIFLISALIAAAGAGIIALRRRALVPGREPA